MYLISTKLLRHFVLVAFVAALALSMTRSHQASAQIKLPPADSSDGSWHVKSRSIWLQPYFDSGFPYGQDQFISTAGTAWATLALTLSAEPPKQSRR